MYLYIYKATGYNVIRSLDVFLVKTTTNNCYTTIFNSHRNILMFVVRISSGYFRLHVLQRYSDKSMLK